MFFNFTFLHEIKKLSLIYNPVTLVLFVFIQNILRWSKHREMNVIHSAYFLQEEAKIILFCKARQLRNIVKAYIYDTLCLRTTKSIEKGISSRFSESYC